jgi:hypothetical protein
MDSFSKTLGILPKQFTLGVVSKIFTLGIMPTNGFYEPITVGGNVWLFGDGQSMLFGDGQEILWG